MLPYQAEYESCVARMSLGQLKLRTAGFIASHESRLSHFKNLRIRPRRAEFPHIALTAPSAEAICDRRLGCG